MLAVTKKLQRYEAITSDDERAINDALTDLRTFPARTDIVRVGDQPDCALVIISGWGIRYQIRRNGSRQITAFLLPGDFCHLNTLAPMPLDHSIAALTPITVAHINRTSIDRLVTVYPRLAKATQASQLVDEAGLRASITSLGRQGAAERVGHVLCDLWVRANAVGLLENGSLFFPLTQVDIADHAGLTSVHVNRVMMRMRGEGLLELDSRYLKLPNFDNLARVSDYRGYMIEYGGRDTMLGPGSRKASQNSASSEAHGNA